MNGGSDMKNADSPTDGDDLRKLVAHAWAAPGMWHGIPDYPLALRVTPRGMSSDGPDFEIRDVKSMPEDHGYRYTQPGKPERASPHYALHDHLSLDNLPKDEEEFARKVSECLDGWPRKHPAKWSNLQSIIASWYMSMFGPAELRFGQRFLVALAGSATFVAAWWPNFLVIRLQWANQYKCLEDQYKCLEESPLPIWSYLLPIICPLLFADLCSWKNHTLGPIRLYAISFLFPFLIWALVTDIYGTG